MLELITFLVDPNDSAATRLKNSMALFSMHAAWFILKDDKLPDDERQAAALEVALELIQR
jgi:hypothetical protein